jgi:hypothetical protein
LLMANLSSLGIFSPSDSSTFLSFSLHTSCGLYGWDFFLLTARPFLATNSSCWLHDPFNDLSILSSVDVWFSRLLLCVSLSCLISLGFVAPRHHTICWSFLAFNLSRRFFLQR